VYVMCVCVCVCMCVCVCVKKEPNRDRYSIPPPSPFPDTSSRSSSDTRRGKVCVTVALKAIRSDVRSSSTGELEDDPAIEPTDQSLGSRKHTTKVTNLSSACASFRVDPHSGCLLPITLPISAAVPRPLIFPPHPRLLFPSKSAFDSSFPVSLLSFHRCVSLVSKVRKLSDSAVTYGDTIMYHKCDRLNNRMERSESRRGGVAAGTSAFAERALARRRETNERRSRERSTKRRLARKIGNADSYSSRSRTSASFARRTMDIRRRKGGNFDKFR